MIAGVCGADVTWVAPTSADNCAGSRCTRLLDICRWRYLPCRSTTITYTATDASGTATCSMEALPLL